VFISVAEQGKLSVDYLTVALEHTVVKRIGDLPVSFACRGFCHSDSVTSSADGAGSVNRPTAFEGAITSANGVFCGRKMRLEKRYTFASKTV
jgi:hypothetical protein